MNGKTATYKAGTTSDTNLATFIYTVGSSDTNTNGLKITGINFKGIIDKANQSATDSLNYSEDKYNNFLDTYSLGIDTIAPSVSFTDPTTAWHKCDYKVIISPTDNLSGIDELYSVWTTSSSVTAPTFPSASNVSSNNEIANPQSSGEYYLWIKAVDKAGNTSSTKSFYTYKFDLQPPTVTINPLYISGAADGTYYIEATVKDGVGNETTKSSGYIYIDVTKPVATVNYSPKNRTAQNVEAVINFNEVATIINNDGNNTYTFTDNGNFTFEFEDEAGNKETAIVEVTWIDRDKPEARIAITDENFNVVSQDKWVNYDLFVTIIPPAQSTIDNLTFNKELVSEITTGSSISSDIEDCGNNKYLVSTYGEFEFIVHDTDTFLESEGAITVRIDKNAPEFVSEIRTTTDWTNEDVVVTITASDDLSTVTYTNDNSYKFTENGSHTFNFIDTAGNKNSYIANVSNIDKDVPIANISYTVEENPYNDEYINKDITAKVNFDSLSPVTITNNGGKDEYTFTPNVIAYGLLSGWENIEPDRMVISHWESISHTIWDYTPNPYVNFTTTKNEYVSADSAVALYFNPTDLATGETRIYETFYGIGSLADASGDANFNIQLTSPQKLTINNDRTGYNEKEITIAVNLDNTGIESTDLNNLVVKLGLSDELNIASNDAMIKTITKLKQGETLSLSFTVIPTVQKNLMVAEYGITVVYGDEGNYAEAKKYIVLPSVKGTPPDMQMTEIAPSTVYTGANKKSVVIKGSQFSSLKADYEWSMYVNNTRTGFS